MAGGIKITINTDNAAFDENPKEETARILRTIAYKIQNGSEPITPRDINGNKVGTFEVSDDCDLFN